jgi:TolB protein
MGLPLLGRVGAVCLAAELWLCSSLYVTPNSDPPRIHAQVGATAAETASANDDSGYATFQSQWFGVSLRYPAQWATVYPEDQYVGQESYRGEDGFFSIAVGGSAGTVEACRIVLKAMSARRQPYGQDPTIEAMEIAGEDACLIWPSDDQERYYSPDVAHFALLLVNYPPHEMSGRSNPSGAAVWLSADTDHMMDIASSMTFTGSFDSAPGRY